MHGVLAVTVAPIDDDIIVLKYAGKTLNSLFGGITRGPGCRLYSSRIRL